MVLLNGLFADWHSWDHVMDDLCEHFHVLRFNSKGQGGTPLGEGALNLQTQVQDVVALLDEHKIQKAHFLGLSHGARIGLALAERFPKRVKRLALACCFANPDALVKAKLNSWKQATHVGGGEHRFDTALPWIWSQELLEKNSQLIEGHRKKASQTPPEVIDKLIHAALSGSIETSFIQAPTLLLAGREDVLTPAWEVEKLSHKIRFCEYLECPGAHSFLLEKPEVVKNSMIPFLNSPDLEAL